VINESIYYTFYKLNNTQYLTYNILNYNFYKELLIFNNRLVLIK